MKAFDELMDVAETLNGPNGCPWDRKQTFFTLQPYVLEEAHEVIEAVDGQNDHEIVEELGDLLYTIIFYAKIAQKESRFSMEDIIQTVKDKLIRRHPHVFGQEKAETEEEVVKNWEAIKKGEKGKAERTSAIEGIPDTLPSLAKAQKMVKVFLKTKFLPRKDVPSYSEKEIAVQVLSLVIGAEQSDIDLESAFRRVLSEQKNAFLQWEASSQKE